MVWQAFVHVVRWRCSTWQKRNQENGIAQKNPIKPGSLAVLTFVWVFHHQNTTVTGLPARGREYFCIRLHHLFGSLARLPKRGGAYVALWSGLFVTSLYRIGHDGLFCVCNAHQSASMHRSMTGCKFSSIAYSRTVWRHLSKGRLDYKKVNDRGPAKLCLFHTHTHTHTHTSARTHTHTITHTYTHAHTHTQSHTHHITHVRTHTHITHTHTTHTRARCRTHSTQTWGRGGGWRGVIV